MNFTVWTDTVKKGTVKFSDDGNETMEMTIDVTYTENEPFATTGRIEVKDNSGAIDLVLTFNPEKKGNKIVLEFKGDFDDEIEKDLSCHM